MTLLLRVADWSAGRSMACGSDSQGDIAGSKTNDHAYGVAAGLPVYHLPCAWIELHRSCVTMTLFYQLDGKPVIRVIISAFYSPVIDTKCKPLS